MKYGNFIKIWIIQWIFIFQMTMYDVKKKSGIDYKKKNPFQVQEETDG